jgi:hypothetical protein
MPSNKKPIITIVLIAIIAIAIFGLMGNSFSTNTIPTGHQSVADKISIIVDGTTYIPTFVSSDETPALSILPLSFTATGSIQCSIWEYRSDTQNSATNYAFLTIFGPDNTGNVYWCEVSRASPNAMTVTYPSGNFNFNAGGNDGYVYFEAT